MRMAGAWMVAFVLLFAFPGGAPLEISMTETSQGCCFSVGGAAVDRVVFCEALRMDISSEGLNVPSGDLAEKMRIMESHCTSDLSSQVAASERCVSASGRSYYPVSGRKLLPTSSTIAAGSQAPSKKISSTPLQNLTLAASGMLLLCCAFICPCFRSRIKNSAEQPVLGRDGNSRMDLSSSFDKNSSSQKSVGTPHHHHHLGPPATPRFSLSCEMRAGSFHADINQIAKATDYFSESHKIGEGKFGTVYKAVLPNGEIVAVKRAKKEHFEALRTEFRNEVDLLAKIDHRCLAKIVDYIDQGKERIIITEFVPNGTLREHLDGQRGKILNFRERLEIAIDVAHGLTYLHLYAERTIIHRDVKSSNILLTKDLRAKVADFGFARTSPVEEDRTHVSTNVRGTVGYLDPEYALTYQLTPKSDVFSYGVLLLEILSGRRPVDPKRPPLERTVVKWAFMKFREGNEKEVLDPLLEEEVDGEVVKRFLSLAFRCTANTRNNRPSMREVVQELWSIRRAYTHP